MIGIGRTILEFITKNTKLILVVLLAIAVVFAFTYRDKYKEQVVETQKQINNIEALTDSVRTYKNEAGELGKEKLALQTDLEQLRTINEDLADEVEKEKGEVEQLTQTVAELKGKIGAVDSTSDAIPLNLSLADDIEQYKFTWEKSNSGDKWSKVLEGYFVVEASSIYTPKIIENKITKDQLNMEFITGIRNEDGKRTIFVRSTYPGLNVTDINGAVLSENNTEDITPDRWGIGITGGYGYNTEGFAPFIGIGLTYNIINF